MKKNVLILILILGKLSVFSQSNDVITFVDNNKYWIEKAKQGKATLNPEKQVPQALFKSSTLKSSIAMESNSHDVELTGLNNTTQSENSVFVNPNENNVLNSNNSTDIPLNANNFNVSSMISNDQGENWNVDLSVNNNSFCDPAVVIGNDGRMFINYINDNDGQSISFSDDNGTNWTESVIANVGSSTVLDKNHLWIDNSQGSNFEGNLYCGWIDIGGANNLEIVISRSTDNGVNWSNPISISDNSNAGSHNQGVNICTGPEGEVYAIWAVYDNWGPNNVDYRETAIGFASSTDGGQNFNQAVRIIDDIQGIRNDPNNHAANVTGKDMRVNSFPSMAVDISGGINDGNIYVVWSNVGEPGVNTGNDVDVYIIRSEDEGANWSNPIRINQDATGQGFVHYFPWITCDPVTGDLAVIFYDDRNVGGAQVEVFVALSQDGGDTWSDFRVSDVAFTPTPIAGLAAGYMGDYLGISSRNNIVYPVWTDNRTGDALTYCSPFVIGCIDNITLQDDQIEIGESVSYQANNSITVAGNNSTYVVDGNGTEGGRLVLTAGESITLLPGFSAELGSEFVATIGSCDGITASLKSATVDANDNSNINSNTDNNEIQTSFMKVYPNPNSGLFNVDFQLQDFEDKNRLYFSVTDLMGKSYLIHNIRNQNYISLDISDLIPGVYILNFYSENNLVETQKILIK